MVQIVCHGFPSIKLLMTELVVQTSSQRSSYDSVPLLPPSDTMHKLFIFLSIIEWVKPSEGSYNVCQLMRGDLKSALNGILEVPKVAYAPSNETDCQTNETLEMSTNLGRDIYGFTTGIWPLSSGLGWDSVLEEYRGT